jgi:archaellum biogenesis protein FlaJ (TadC family)
VSVESHGRNRRIERAIRSLREAVVKKEEFELEDSIRETIKGYNDSYHSAIKCTPKEVIEEAVTDKLLKMENSLEGKCADNFVERKREVFISRQRENLGNKAKESKGIFKKLEIYGML